MSIRHFKIRPVPSPDKSLIATLQKSSLDIVTAEGLGYRSISLSADIVSSCRFLRWAQLGNGSRIRSQAAQEVEVGGRGGLPSTRILLACNDCLRVYDIHDPDWAAIVERASSGLGDIVDVTFGYTSNEILVFSDFGTKLTIWSLISSRGIEIKDPKSGIQCYDYRPKTGHLAILVRPAAQDILMLLNPGDYTLFSSMELPTMDAQEVAWSPDSHWLAIRDAASNGHKLLIYTADGHLFKSYTRSEKDDEVGLGIKTMRWSPLNGKLALGDFNDDVLLLNKNTFSPIADFHHAVIIQSPQSNVWQEQVDVSKKRSYAIAPQPTQPPTSTASIKTSFPPRGISILEINGNGSLLATKDDMLPTTVWIWSLKTLESVAILVHHAPVRTLAWHPTENDLLLIQCALTESSIHLWKSSWESPQIVTPSLGTHVGRLEIHWMMSPETSQFRLLLSSNHQHVTALISENGEIIPEDTGTNQDHSEPSHDDAESMFDEGNSIELSPIKVAQDEKIGLGDEEDGLASGYGMENEIIDDTFRYRRHVRAAG